VIAMMVTELYRLNAPVTGTCRLCAAPGAHRHLDKNLGGLICDACIVSVLFATAALEATGFHHCTDPQQGEPNN
jgi:hypothetical protein